MTPFDIRLISAAATLTVRHPVLRAGLPLETAIFSGDDAPATQHFGVFAEEQLVGVASIYRAALPERSEVAGAWQLRGMAILPEFRGRSLGHALLAACVEAARRQSATLLWCNARTPAVGFYRKHGFLILGGEFEIPTAGPHFRMWLPLGE
jgi:GNAT superfamily N-acetyltransferase